MIQMKNHLAYQLSKLIRIAAISIAVLPHINAYAEELVVKVEGLKPPYGSVGCSLFDRAEGFPMDNSRSRTVWIKPSADNASCAFNGLDKGRYAVSVAHDANGNGKLDTNFVGMPTEQWGVSNNVRPTLRAPTFEEAAISIGGSSPSSIEIKVSK